MQCWGYNYYGQVMLFALCFASMMRLHNVELCFTHFGLSQLGDDSTTQRLAPVGVVGLSGGVSSISLGEVRSKFGLLVIEMLFCIGEVVVVSGDVHFICDAFRCVQAFVC